MPEGPGLATSKERRRAPGDLAVADIGTRVVTGAGPVPPRVDGTAASDGRLQKRSRMGVLFWVCLAWVALMVLLALAASVLPLKSPTFQDYSAVNVGPTLHHLLGTDDLGRDLLSRIVFGSRVSLVIGFASIALGMATGGTLGLLAGYRGGASDTLLNAGSFVLLAFPPLLAIMVIEAFWGRSLWKLTLVFAVVAAPQLFRVMRASTIATANREYVVAARAFGSRSARIMVRELLPNVLPAAISFALIGVAVAIIIEGSLAFLGLSIALPTASLGNIINEGVQNNNLQLNPYIALWPSLYIFLMLSSLNLMADRLRSRFEAREGKL
ncbi:MAG TPA: ABC transporter permease [Acidimicrobiales bacterium]|nr:ABC transporter permease [Acidimicrobiales bacterium]